MEAGGPGAAVPGCEARVPQLEGDFSLNASNVLAADLLLGSGLRCARVGVWGGGGSMLVCLLKKKGAVCA
jgi:hypothetical protein